MPDPKFQFRDWMNSLKLKSAQVTNRFGITPQTVNHWRSKGVPESRQEFVSRVISTWDTPHPIGDKLTVFSSEEEFDAWNRAALDEGKTIREWAREGLNEMAREYFNDPQMKLPVRSHLKVAKAPTSKVAEEAPDLSNYGKTADGGK